MMRSIARHQIMVRNGLYRADTTFLDGMDAYNRHVMLAGIRTWTDVRNNLDPIVQLYVQEYKRRDRNVTVRSPSSDLEVLT